MLLLVASGFVATCSLLGNFLLAFCTCQFHPKLQLQYDIVGGPGENRFMFPKRPRLRWGLEFGYPQLPSVEGEWGIPPPVLNAITGVLKLKDIFPGTPQLYNCQFSFTDNIGSWRIARKNYKAVYFATKPKA